MSRSLSYLRRALFAVAFLGSLGLGATQAFATPDVAARAGACQVGGGPYPAPLADPDLCPPCPNGTPWCDGVNPECQCMILMPIDP